MSSLVERVLDEVTNSRIASALKLLTVYSYSLQKFTKKFLKPTFNIEQLAQQLTVKNVSAQDHLVKAVATFAVENQCSKFSVVTSNMIVIGRNTRRARARLRTARAFVSLAADCLLVVDKTGTPQDLSTILTSSDGTGHSGQTTFNRVRIDADRFK
jgi:hypothetical protein